MEETLASLNTRIIQRKKQRNRLIRFNKLPLEIASNILWLSVVDPWKRKIAFSFIQRLRTILSVCSSWRVLVEGSPQFWSIIEFSSPQAAISHLLKKSKSSPLEIKCFSDGDYKCAPGPELDRLQRIAATITYLNLIVPQSHRVRSLILSTLMTHGVLALFEKPAPLLEELNLSFAHCTLVQPLDLFCGQAGRLKDVSLENIPVRWDSEVLVGLRSLKIEGRLKYSPTMVQVRRLVEANPELEKMVIEDVTVSEGFKQEMVEFTQSGKWSPVIMKKMRELKLFSLPFDLVEAVLGNIEVPSIEHFNLKGLFQGLPADRLWSDNLKHMAPPILNRRSKGAELAEITLGKGSVRLSIHLPGHGNPPIQIQFSNVGGGVSGIEWLAEKFLREDGFPAVAAQEIFQVSLTFGDSFDMGGRAFVPFLDQLRAVKVKSLTIGRGCKHGEELIKYLGEVQEGFQWPLPHLMSLTVSGRAEMATHLSTALQHRKPDVPTEDPATAQRPVPLEVLNIEGLGGVERKVEKALAKHISSSGTFIRASRRSLTFWGGHGDDWEELDEDDEDENM
ncbi:hypothetical protein FRC00_003494 [Tulasnella sp. 408]|nr:hypothetical protein FRC00_003494 [Tulasnella sp. 408]